MSYKKSPVKGGLINVIKKFGLASLQRVDRRALRTAAARESRDLGLVYSNDLTVTVGISAKMASFLYSSY